MNLLSLDIRDNFLRVLLFKDSKPVSARLIEGFSISNAVDAKEKLITCLKDIGWKKGKINLILPINIVNYKSINIPAMDLKDKEKVINREISKDMKKQKYVFNFRQFMTDKPGRQEVFIEYITYSEIMQILNFFKDCGVKPDVITTSMEGNIRVFNKLRPETEGNELSVDIGMNFIEILLFNNRDVLGYWRIPIPIRDETQQTTVMTLEQLYKIRTYTLIDALYKFFMEFKNTSNGRQLNRLWIGGLGTLSPDIAEILADTLSTKTAILDPFNSTIEHGSTYSAIAGVSFIEKTEHFINLLPPDIKQARIRLAANVMLAASFLFYLLIVIGSYLILNNHEKELKISLERARSLQQIKINQGKSASSELQVQTMYEIASNSPMLYGVLRDIANLIPDGVSLEELHIEKTKKGTILKLNAILPYSKSVSRDMLLSRFVTAIEKSSKLRKTGQPEVSITKKANEQKIISVIATYEVVK